jgi:dipeptidase D
VRVLRDLESRCRFVWRTECGGSARNALPREASATLAVPVGDGDALAASLVAWQSSLREELRGVDEALEIDLTAASVEEVMSSGDQFIWLASLLPRRTECAAAV